MFQQEFEPPSGELKTAIEKQFGDLDGLKSKFNPIAAAIQVLKLLAVNSMKNELILTLS